MVNLTCKDFNPLQSLSNLSKPCLTEQGLKMNTSIWASLNYHAFPIMEDFLQMHLSIIRIHVMIMTRGRDSFKVVQVHRCYNLPPIHGWHMKLDSIMIDCQLLADETDIFDSGLNCAS
jgi:hypothetical protein